MASYTCHLRQPAVHPQCGSGSTSLHASLPLSPLDPTPAGVMEQRSQGWGEGPTRGSCLVCGLGLRPGCPGWKGAGVEAESPRLPFAQPLNSC